MNRVEKKCWREFRDSCKRNGLMPMFYTALLRHTNHELEKVIKRIKQKK